MLGIREVNRLAFEGDEEAVLVVRLRAEGLVVASLVAVAEDRMAGHIFFSRLPIETPDGAIYAVALAPMAVRPELQRNGIGSGLVQRGLGVARQRGEAIVIVVGHPDYYPRFGFSAELARRLSGCERILGTRLQGVCGDRPVCPQGTHEPVPSDCFREASPECPQDFFMALELTPGALDGVTGAVRYPEAFGLGEQPADKFLIGNQQKPGGIC